MNMYQKCEEYLYNFNSFQGIALNEDTSNQQRRAAISSIKKIQNAFNSLSDSEKQLIYYRYFNNMSYAQLEHMTGVGETILMKQNKDTISRISSILFEGV
jgi:DNA-directed RNA polymerase specialized sigma subunit